MASTAEQLKAYKRQHYEENKQKYIDKATKCGQENIERRREISRNWVEANRFTHNANNKRWTKQNPEKYLCTIAKGRAKKKGLEFDITYIDIKIPKLCPLLGINIDPFSHDFDEHPSIDRIDNNKGYIKGNVMVISYRANRIKAACCAEELLLLSINLLEYE